MFAALNSFLTRAVSAAYFLNKSLRFRSSASAYLNRTFGTPTNNKKWTWSGWVKRGALGANETIFSSYQNGSNYFDFRFNASDQLFVQNRVGAVNLLGTNTTAVYRDPSAWYHIMFVFDSDNATAANRNLLYVNGVSVAWLANSGSSDASNFNASGYEHDISGSQTAGLWALFDGEMAEVNFIDGRAVPIAELGAYSTYNQWLPIAYAGTYGTNGFYLPFSGGTATSYAGSFNGSSQYLSASDNAAFELGSNDFTIEAWIYITGGTSGAIIGKELNVNDDVFLVTLNASNQVVIALSSNGITYQLSLIGSTALANNTWYHVATTRIGSSTNNVKLYVNGVQDGTGTFAGSVLSSTSALSIGYRTVTGPQYFTGSISNVRLVNGTGVYTANFIPPTAPLTAITNTSLLTLQNATIVDNSTNAFTITNTGTVVTSVQSPFGMPTIAADSSGNANNWTPNNISLTAGSTYDSLTDVPTLTSTTVANYAVLNPLDAATTTGVSSNGNLSWTNSAATHQCIRGSIAIPATGAYYFEAINVTSNNATIGVGFGLGASSASLTVNMGGGQANVFSWYSGGNANSYIVAGTVTLATFVGGAFVASDVLQLAVDTTNTKMWLGKNNVWYNSTGGTTGNPTTGANPTFTTSMVGLFPMTEVFTNTVNFNFGQQPFTYTAPSGFLPLNTFNIAAGTVTTSGTFTGNLSTDGPFVFLNGTPTAMTINGNAVTFGTHADKLANGFKVRSSSASYNASGSNTYVATTVAEVLKYENAQPNP